MALNIIDFSNGIRPEEIQENFQYLQDQIARERLSIGGAGIASGLDITVDVSDDVFDLIISDGSIIDDEGNEVFIKGKVLNVSPPKLQSYTESCVLNEDKTISLKFTPYALNRRRPVEYLSSFEPEKSGIVIKYKNSLNLDDYIRVRDVIGKTVTVTGALKRDLEVSYKYTAKRIDILYINNKLELAIKEGEGSTSTTPSVSKLPEDAKYLVAYIEVDNEYIDEIDNTPHAYMFIKDDLRSIRNLYTSSDGTLYICGVPFDDLQIIHMREPHNPKPYTLWLNLADNTLYCWRATDEFIYKNRIDITTDFASEINAGLTFSTYMGFYMGQNELSVYLNEVKLTLGTDYEEFSDDIATAGGNEGDEKIRGNGFRILDTLERPDEYEDVLIPGDVLTYIIRYKDSQYMWVPINKMNYVHVKNSKVFSTYYEDIDEKYIYEIQGQDRKAYFDSMLANSLGINPKTEYPHKYQYFLFDRVKDMNMHFTPGKHELSVMINQMYLHEDQFKEITVFDLIEKKLPVEVLQASVTHFNWSKEYLDNHFNGVYDNSGIGFMLVDPLDSGANADGIGSIYTSYYGSNDLFVEATVERRVCSTPINRKLERSATFILEDSFEADSAFIASKIVQIDNAKYLYDECQLEVFVDGIKQTLGVDYIEEFGYLRGEIEIKPIDPKEEVLDQDYYIRKKAAACNKFKFLDNKSIVSGNRISYKITTNVYSYDHINNILDDIGDVLEDCKATVETSNILMNEFRDNIEDRVLDMELQVKDLNDKIQSDGSDIVDIGDLPAIVVNNMVKSLNHINKSIVLEAGKDTYPLQGVYQEDYINVFYHDISNKLDSYWVNGLHYKLTTQAGVLILRVINIDEIDSGDVLYISGIKLSNKHNMETVVDGKIAPLVTEEQMRIFVEACINNLYVTPINDEDGDQ